ncbi:MAG: PLP-dependent transferase [Bacteroides stercoris]
MKELTGAAEVIALNSGMAAISNTLFSIAAAGKNIVTSRHLFGNTYSFIAGTLSRFGVEPRLRVDLTDIGAVEKVVDSNTCCIYVEIITNPQMEVADLQALSRIVHERGIPLIVDTTLIPFTEFDSHSLGVDIEVVSSTKYLSGGATSIGGLVTDYGTCPGFGKRMRTEMLLTIWELI